MRLLSLSILLSCAVLAGGCCRKPADRSSAPAEPARAAPRATTSPRATTPPRTPGTAAQPRATAAPPPTAAAPAPPPTAATTAAPRPTATVKRSDVPTAGEATINAPAFRNGAPRRGIVRSAPNQQAPEVERLDNGTRVNLLRPMLPGGWYEVSWPFGVDSSRGFIHGDVLRVTLYGD